MAIRRTENGESDGWEVNKIKGEVGNAGKSIRVTAFEGGVYYYNGEEPADDGICYLDIVADESIVLDKSDVKYYVCKESHLSSGDKNELLTDQWEPMETTNPIVTPLILAEKIKADFIDTEGLNTHELTVLDENNNTILYAGNPDYPLLCGSTDPEEAVTKIDKDGKITATGGYIGGFDINSDFLGITETDPSAEGFQEGSS